jgi:hypothetical protein
MGNIKIEIKNEINKLLNFGEERLLSRTISSKGSTNTFLVAELVSKSLSAVTGASVEVVNANDANISKLTFVHVGLYDEDAATVNLNDKKLTFTLSSGLGLGADTCSFQAGNLTIQNITGFGESISVVLPTIEATRDLKLVVLLGYKA